MMTFEKLAERLRASEGFASADRVVTEQVLQSLRAAFETSADPYDRRLALCAQIGAAADQRLRAALVQERDEFETRSIKTMIADIDLAFGRSAQEGWSAWLRAIGEAMWRFRDRYAFALVGHPFAFEPERQSRVQAL
jgi:hypothetical protein